ncbi:unnamed protein product [Brassica oleracea var. botrytis]
MIVLVFAMFSVQTSQLVRTRITTRIHYPKPETFNRFFAILLMQRSGSSGSSSNNRNPRHYRELATLFAKISAAEMKRFKRNPRTDLIKALKTNRGGESIGFNTEPLIKPLQVGRRITKVTPSHRTKRSDEFCFLTAAVLGIDGTYSRWAGNTSNLTAHEHTKERNRKC